ncbi:hypothetical protein MMC25_008191 [Agyrium rufum]|nr:hypothetical protein [Agyrium rufum]
MASNDNFVFPPPPPPPPPPNQPFPLSYQQFGQPDFLSGPNRSFQGQSRGPGGPRDPYRGNGSIAARGGSHRSYGYRLPSQPYRERITESSTSQSYSRTNTERPYNVAYSQNAWNDGQSNRIQGEWNRGSHGVDPRQSTQRVLRPTFQGRGRGHNVSNLPPVGVPRASLPRTPAAPAVPSFGLPLPIPLSEQPEPKKEPRKRKREHNQLGLTPKTEDHESSEEDVDEEQKLATYVAGKSGDAGLQFSHKGKSMVLKSKDDIAAWIEERRRNFPTKARAEGAKLQRQARMTEARGMRKPSKEEIPRPKKRKSTETQDSSKRETATQGEEKLRRKYEKAQKKVAALEARLGKVPRSGKPEAAAPQRINSSQPAAEDLAWIQSEILRGGNKEQEEMGIDPAIALTLRSDATAMPDLPTPKHTAGKHAKLKVLDSFPKLRQTPTAESEDAKRGAASSDGESDLTSSDDMEFTSDSEVESETDSTSESTDTADDAAPAEETISRQEVKVTYEPRPLGTPSIALSPSVQNKPGNMCKNFQQGRCKWGDNCNFRHEGFVKTKEKRSDARAQDSNKKSLYERMIASEKDKEDEAILDHILYLGRQGVLR